MAEKLYPERQRCKTCRKGFDKTVLEGLYCSYRCLGIRPPSGKVDDAPRNCKREVSGKWDFKTRFPSPALVPERLQKDPGTNIYLCDYCHCFHVGHSRPLAEIPLESLHRTVRDLNTLGSVIKRVRESRNIDIKVLAKRLNVPVVRITEIENGSATMNAKVLFDIMNALRISVTLTQK